MGKRVRMLGGSGSASTSLATLRLMLSMMSDTALRSRSSRAFMMPSTKETFVPYALRKGQYCARCQSAAREVGVERTHFEEDHHLGRADEGENVLEDLEVVP